MKRAFAVLVTVVMLVSLLCVNVLAAGTLVISGNSARAQAGQWATIILEVTQNIGFAGISIYPVITDASGNRLDWQWVADDSNTELLASDGTPFFDMEVGTMMVLYNIEDCTDTGVLVEVSFLVPTDAQAGNYTVAFQVYENECFNATFESVTAVLPTVSIAVSTATPAPNPGGGGGIPSEHTHTPVAIPAEEPTCTEPGKTEGERCSTCNKVLKAQEEIPALGHTEVTDAAVDATCTAAGKTEGKHCSVCNAVVTAQQEIAATSHSLSAWTVTTAPTCTVNGVESASCACGAVETREIPATGEHTFGEWNVTKEATRKEAGEETRTCACGQTENREIPVVEGLNPIIIIVIILLVIAVAAAAVFFLLKKKHA